MRIAFDAKWYHRGPAGVRTHTRNLLDTLREIDAENEYDVFLRGADAIPAHLEGPRWRLRRLRPDLSAPRVWWALPRAVRDQPVDLFFTQSLVPSTRRAPRVVTVHDVLWHTFSSDRPGHSACRDHHHRLCAQPRTDLRDVGPKRG
jgi:hypothetical protein